MKTLNLSHSLIILLILLHTVQLSALGSDISKKIHDREKKELQEKYHTENHEDHKIGEGSSDHEEAESSPAVGPDKGILEKGEGGIKLSPEAIKSFELKMQNISTQASEYPRATLVEVKNEQFVYQFREGWIKKIAVKVIRKNKNTVILEIPLVKAGDKVIVEGTGFVRVSELIAEEGVSHGHSH